MTLNKIFELLCIPPFFIMCFMGIVSLGGALILGVLYGIGFFLDSPIIILGPDGVLLIGRITFWCAFMALFLYIGFILISKK